MRTTKISIAIDKEQLRLARRAAKAAALSLSGYIALALASRLEDQGRIDASRKLQATWGSQSIPTEKEREAFLAQMARPRGRRVRAA